MSYSIKEMFHTLQGEGANAGRSAVFCRFAGCNLWSGYEVDRANAICNFCDTDFVGVDGKNGGEFKWQLKFHYKLKYNDTSKVSIKPEKPVDINFSASETMSISNITFIN